MFEHIVQSEFLAVDQEIIFSYYTTGISTGNFEVRADGTFHEWSLFNQYPAGAAKIQIMDAMFMGLRTQVKRNST